MHHWDLEEATVLDKRTAERRAASEQGEPTQWDVAHREGYAQALQFVLGIPYPEAWAKAIEHWRPKRYYVDPSDIDETPAHAAGWVWLGDVVTALRDEATRLRLAGYDRPCHQYDHAAQFLVGRFGTDANRGGERHDTATSDERGRYVREEEEEE